LLSALLEPNSALARHDLAEAIALDPALALWSGFHHASRTSAENPPATVQNLAAWLSDHLGSLLRGDKVTAASETLAVATQRQNLAALAAADVGAASSGAPTPDLLDDPSYLTRLVRNISHEWLILAGATSQTFETFPGWLGAIYRESASSSDCAAGTTDSAGSAAEEARQRWLVPPGFASQNFAIVAARLASLESLQATFEERLEAEKLASLAEFAAGAGHEINNPLAVISGRAQLFLRHEQDPERRHELAVINAQARRIHEMIADLMLFARPPEPRPTACDITELIDTVVAELEERAAEGGVEWDVRLAEDLPTIHADSTQMLVALRAVCENALNALADRKAGRIEITGEPAVANHSEMLAITIRDNGPGMSPEVRRHAFDPYFSGRGAGRGLGNGLSKCWRIITAHGGRVAIDSTPSGTFVQILIPLSGSALNQTNDAGALHGG
jgi:signal transduction histidine kinase